MGTALSGGPFVAASSPNILQYQQWHSVGGDKEQGGESGGGWDGAAVLWFAEVAQGQPRPDAAVSKFVADTLLRDEGRFIDLPRSDFFLAAPVAPMQNPAASARATTSRL